MNTAQDFQLSPIKVSLFLTVALFIAARGAMAAPLAKARLLTYQGEMISSGAMSLTHSTVHGGRLAPNEAPDTIKSR